MIPLSCQHRLHNNTDPTSVIDVNKSQDLTQDLRGISYVVIRTIIRTKVQPLVGKQALLNK
jgi:hypothetical protein